MNSVIANEYLSELVQEKMSTIDVFHIQCSKLNNLELKYYLNFLANVLSEEFIDKLMEEFYATDFAEVNLIDDTVLLTNQMSEEDIYFSNENFIEKKQFELISILNSLQTDKKLRDKIDQSRSKLSNTFKWESSQKALKVLYDELVRKEFIDDVGFAEFKKGFSGMSLPKPLNIPWRKTATRNTDIYIKLMFYLLKELSPQHLIYVHGAQIYNKARFVFCDGSKHKLKPFGDLRQPMSDFKNNGVKDKINTQIVDEIVTKVNSITSKVVK